MIDAIVSWVKCEVSKVSRVVDVSHQLYVASLVILALSGAKNLQLIKLNDGV